LFRGNFTGIGQEQSEPDAPSNFEQLAFVAERRCRQGRAGVIHWILERLTQFVAHQAIKEVDPKIFAAFAFGAPRYRHLESFNGFWLNPLDTVLELEQFVRFQAGLKREQFDSEGGLTATYTALRG
jgi:hypothetical protein